MNTLKRGFTIVELIIVLVVIGVLVAITVVSYNSVRTRANEQAVSSDIVSTATSLSKYKADNSTFPSTQALFNSDIKKANTSGATTYTYTYYSPSATYCLTATRQNLSYYLYSTDTQPTKGSACPPVSTLAITSATSYDGEPNLNITVTGTGTPGNKIIGSECAPFSSGFSNGTHCYTGSTASTTVAANGTWSLSLYFADAIVIGSTIFNTNPDTTNANCSGTDQCEFQIFDFGSTQNPTSINQATGMKTVSLYAQIQ